MKKITFVVLMVPVLLILIFQECRGGVVVNQVMKDREGRASTVVLYFSGERLRTDDEEGGLTTIMDFRADRMVMVDHRSKSYVETKFSQWEKEVTQRFKKNLPATKPRVRRIVVRRAGETATINGFRTEKVQVFADGELIEDNWVTREVDMAEVEKVMEKVAAGFSKEMNEGREIYDKLKPYGFPILIKDYTMARGSAMDILEVKKLEKKELKDEVFSPPGGYERVIPGPPKK